MDLMTTTQQPVIPRAGLRRVCCDLTPDKRVGNTSRAHWELYLVVYNTTERWPSHAWPASRRHQVPTIAERTQALAELGYAPAPRAEWDWQESTTADFHGHPVGVYLFASIDIVPLDQASATGGEPA